MKLSIILEDDNFKVQEQLTNNIDQQKGIRLIHFIKILFGTLKLIKKEDLI